MSRRPTDITGSRRRRRRARAVRTFLRGLAVLAALAIVSGAVWAVGFSPALAATAVEVRGVAVLTSDQVAEVAAVPLGLPLVRLATGPIAGRVTAMSPVATVDVTRRWPHTVVITVTERQPVYFLRRADGTGSLVDRGGVAYHDVPALPQGLLPVTVARADDRALRDAATVVALLPAPVAERAVSLTVESVDRIVIQLQAGRQLVWGSAEQSELKGQVAVALLTVEASLYDVSAPSHPATRA